MEAEKEERVKLEFDDVCIELNIDQETKDNAWESYMMIYNDYVLEVRKNGVILSHITSYCPFFVPSLSLFVVSLSFLCLFFLRLHVHTCTCVPYSALYWRHFILIIHVLYMYTYICFTPSLSPFFPLPPFLPLSLPSLPPFSPSFS